MRKLFLCSVTIVALSIVFAAQGFAQAAGVDANEEASPPLGDDVEVISMNGSITRGKCPHTCEDRNIPRKDCKEWRSKMYGDRCYVEDLRMPSNAIADGGAKKKAK